MAQPDRAVLVVEPDSRIRGIVLAQLSGLGMQLFDAADGERALEIMRLNDIHVVLSELYLPTGDSECLIDAIRRDRSLRKTRAVAHTQFDSARDRDWAMRLGADAFLIRPVRSARLREVVARLANERGRPKSRGRTDPLARRDSLDGALSEREAGRDADVTVIVFGRAWWSTLSPSQQVTFRRRARKLGVALRSDALLSDHYVEVRASADQGLSSERSESRYKS